MRFITTIELIKNNVKFYLNYVKSYCKINVTNGCDTK